FMSGLVHTASINRWKEAGQRQFTTWRSSLSHMLPRESGPPAPSSVFPLTDIIMPVRSPELRASLAIAKGHSDEARAILLAEIPKAKEPSLGRLRFLLGKATPDITLARAPLEALAGSEHLLAKWARLRLAERLRDRDPNAAVAYSEGLMREEMFKTRAEQMMVLALFDAGRYVEAEPLLRSLVNEAPEKSAALTFSMPLATIVSAKGDIASQKEALALYRRIATKAPLSESANQARAAADKLLAAMPAPTRIALSQLTADEAFAEAEALADGREYIRAAERFGALAKRFPGDKKIVCDARLGQARALFNARKRDQALVVFEDVARICATAEHRATAHFQAGKVMLRKGDPRAAIMHYDAVANEFPEHKLADDSLLAAASAFHDLGDADGERTRLQRLIALGPRSDMRPDARFMLSWLERGQRNWAAALAQFDEAMAEGLAENGEDLVGRTPYWRARTLLDMDKRDEGEDAMLTVFRSRPLSYYGQQALARIDELDHPLALQLTEELREAPRTPENPLRLPLRQELQNKEFLTAIELLRVAEPVAAQEELEWMKCFQPDSPDDLYLLCSALFSEFGADGRATTLARRRGIRIMSEEPRGQTLALWRVVFPRAYAGVLEDAASDAEVPAAFVRAVAREESSFDPNAVSPANAYGLIQLIRPTARTYAAQVQLPHDVESLKKPDVNLRIGTRFMRSLFDRFKKNVAVVPAAYNAGPGAADKWIKERGTMTLDEWIETIPYTETRRYSRRVLQSYAVYAWLDEGRMPPLPKDVAEQPEPKVARDTDRAGADERTRAGSANAKESESKWFDWLPSWEQAPSTRTSTADRDRDDTRARQRQRDAEGGRDRERDARESDRRSNQDDTRNRDIEEPTRNSEPAARTAPRDDDWVPPWESSPRGAPAREPAREPEREPDREREREPESRRQPTPARERDARTEPPAARDKDAWIPPWDAHGR
ncbi:MAG: transglycosylase SLT domain-containing protein, partial [Polyangiales bacterium]